jgi:hypothetical protein
MPYKKIGLCFNQLQTIQKIKKPIQSSSQYNNTITADTSVWSITPPKNERVKYDSYIRVLRRRRGMLCCH